MAFLKAQQDGNVFILTSRTLWEIPEDDRQAYQAETILLSLFSRVVGQVITIEVLAYRTANDAFIHPATLQVALCDPQYPT
ncbi:MAG: hypothetical protein ACFFB3_02235 [Candidatus Hodarchaeota archaeon]